MSDRNRAKELYLKSDGEMPLTEIAEEVNRPAGTIRGWKSRYKWDDELGVTKSVTLQDKCNATKKVAADKAKDNKHEVKAAKTIVKEVAANNELNDKQQLFCIYYLKYFNATKAYQKAYDCTYITANTNGPALLVNTGIKAEIERLKAERLNGIYLDGKDILQQYINIAFSDVTDYIEFGRREVPVMTAFGPMKGPDGKTLMQEVNYIDFKEAAAVDGTIVSEISQGKNGVSVKLQDKMKALDWLTKNLERFSNDDIDLDKELMKVRIEKEKAQVKKIESDIAANSMPENENYVADKLEEILNGID